MYTTRLSLLYVGFLIILTACQPAAQAPRNKAFQPGDVIDGMRLTTGAKDAIPLWAFCTQPQHAGNTTTSDCHVHIVPRLAIGQIVMPGYDTLAMLDAPEISWELSIDHQPLDLERFGSYDYVLPTRSPDPSPVREVFVQYKAWDVVLTHLSSGEHSLQGVAQIGNDRYTWVIHLAIEESILVRDDLEEALPLKGLNSTHNSIFRQLNG